MNICFMDYTCSTMNVTIGVTNKTSKKANELVRLINVLHL